MRHEPIDISIPDKNRAGTREARRRLAQFMASRRQIGEPLLPDAVDEVFAFLPAADGQSRRVDDADNASHSPAAVGAREKGNHAALLNVLAAQVAALDRQCEELTSLLQSLDERSVTE
jgi:hypothetical protein